MMLLLSPGRIAPSGFKARAPCLAPRWSISSASSGHSAGPTIPDPAERERAAAIGCRSEPARKRTEGGSNRLADAGVVELQPTRAPAIGVREIGVAMPATSP